ncbi:MAG TPA: flagellar motor switch protein FliM [Bryobacteraceae bacterium]|nr:flagellar motor switch protein FliM [Bryobacteraceae bacterium]
MASDPISPENIEPVLDLPQETRDEGLTASVYPFDFQRADRIAKSQLRSIYVLHENFVRSITSSLSAYLRTYVVVNLVSVQQVSYGEFLDRLPSPSFMACLDLRPFEGNAVIEINPTLVFPILEILLGGNGKFAATIEREVTEIEVELMDGMLRILLQDLKEAWKPVAHIDFAIQSRDTEPQLLRLMAPGEAVVAVSIEIKLGESTGLLNIAMPSLMMKMMRQKFDQQWAVRRTEPTAEEQQRIFDLIQDARIEMDALLNGVTITARELLRLKAGDVLMFDVPAQNPAEVRLNGRRQFDAHIVSTGRKRGAVLGTVAWS